MAKKVRKLVDLEIEAVAGVDKAANGRRFLVIKRADNEPKPSLLERIAALFKQEYGVDPNEVTVEEADALLEKGAEPKDDEEEKGVGDMPDFEELLKSAPKELQDAVAAALAQKDAEIETLQKQVAGGEPQQDEINKADLPEPVRKRLEDLEKRAAEAERIAKAEQEARVRAEIRKRAETYSNAGPVDEIAEMIYKAYEVSQEYGEQVESVLKTAHERVAEGTLFKELGSGGGDVAATTWGKVEKLADEIQKANPSLTRPEAIAKAFELNPDLEREYAEEVRG